MKSKILTYLCLIILKSATAHPRASQVCSSDECYHQSESLLSKIDPTASPCDDFYQFACGNYKDPGNPLSSQQEVVDDKLTQIFTEELKDTDDKFVNLVKKFYQTCLTDGTPMINYIQQKVNLRHKKVSEFENSWTDVIQKLQFFQVLDSYVFSVHPELVDDSVFLVVDQPRFDKQTSFQDKNSQEAQEYYSFLIKFASQFRIEASEAEVSLMAAVEFKEKLSKIVDKNSEAEIELISVSEAQEVFKFINCTILMQNFFENGQIDDNFRLGVRNREILKKIDQLLFGSSDEDILNYFVWRFIESAFLFYIPETFRNFGVQKTPNFSILLPDNCLSITKDRLDIAVAVIYIQNFYKDSTKAELLDMIDIIRRTLKSQFSETEWMSETTKSAAIKKLEKMEFYAGYPDKLNDLAYFTEYYEDLNFSGESLVQLVGMILKNHMVQSRKLLSISSPSDARQMLIAQEAADSVFKVNAFYNPYMNYFIIDAAFVSDNIYADYRPMSMNFGAVGFTIGHEILHGFDSNGRKRDENGKRLNWWTEKDEMEFLSQSECFVDQYGSYVEPVTGWNVNGTLTLGENIADNGGVYLAYNTYQKWLKTNKNDQTLPNANFTSSQLFWMSAAQMHCNNHDKDEMEQFIKTDSHSPGRLRVIGTFGNSNEFLSDFECPIGSMMNRKDKCKIW